MTKLLKTISMNGVALPMPSDYHFEWKKTYIEEPSRNNSGAIAVFPDKFFVPYFTVQWNVMKIDDYSKLMGMIESDEQTVEFYDSYAQEYKTAKFYVQQPTYNKLWVRRMKFDFVQDLQLVFAGTMNDVGPITISYDANEGTGSVPSIRGENGDEFKVSFGKEISRSGYKLRAWNTDKDGHGVEYDLGDIRVMLESVTLYAQWEAIV